MNTYFNITPPDQLSMAEQFEIWDRALAARLDAFWRLLDNPEADPFEVQTQQRQLGISNEQIAAHRKAEADRFDEYMKGTNERKESAFAFSARIAVEVMKDIVAMNLAGEARVERLTKEVSLIRTTGKGTEFMEVMGYHESSETRQEAK